MADEENGDRLKPEAIRDYLDALIIRHNAHAQRGEATAVWCQRAVEEVRRYLFGAP